MKENEDTRTNLQRAHSSLVLEDGDAHTDEHDANLFEMKENKDTCRILHNTNSRQI